MTDRVRTAPSFVPGTTVIVTEFDGREIRATVQPNPSSGMVRVRVEGTTWDTLADVRKVREV